jgi:hypothetical protein
LKLSTESIIKSKIKKGGFFMEEEKRAYNRRTKWYAVRTVEYESESKNEIQRKLEENPNDLPMIIRGEKIDPHLEQKVMF